MKLGIDSTNIGRIDMKFKYGKCYRHESGAVGMIVGKIKSLAIGNALLMELNAPGQRTTFQPCGIDDKHTKGWTLITRSEFVAEADRLNKELIEKHKTAIKEDNCMRKVVECVPQDDCLAIMLECSHIIRFDKGDKEPKVGSKIHCSECVEQNEMIASRLGMNKKPDLKVIDGGKKV